MKRINVPKLKNPSVADSFIADLKNQLADLHHEDSAEKDWERFHDCPPVCSEGAGTFHPQAT